MSPFASQEQALAHAQNLVTALSETLRDAIEGPSRVAGQAGDPLTVMTDEQWGRVGRPDFDRENPADYEWRASLVAERAAEAHDCIGEPRHGSSQLFHGRVCRLALEILRLVQCPSRFFQRLRHTRVLHSSSSSVGDAPAVTGARNSAADSTEEEPHSLADLADDLSRVVEGLRHLATEEEWAKVSPRRYHSWEVL